MKKKEAKSSAWGAGRGKKLKGSKGEEERRGMEL